MIEFAVQLLPLLLAVIGLACLIVGADFLVRGGARLARAFNVSPVVIGLTVVAIGTSAPELMVSLGAAWRGSPDLATGNVVGSNLANIGLILGIAGLLRPLPVSLRLLRVEVPILFGATVVFAAMAVDGRLGRLEGGVLLAALCALTGYNIRAARREESPNSQTSTAPPTASAATCSGSRPAWDCSWGAAICSWGRRPRWRATSASPS